MEHFESFRYFVMFLTPPHLSFRDFARVTPAPFPRGRALEILTAPGFLVIVPAVPMFRMDFRMTGRT